MKNSNTSVPRYVNRLKSGIKRLLINGIADRLGIDILSMAYFQKGILKYLPGNSGEDRFISQTLAKCLPDSPVVFDVGANVGDFSDLILRKLHSPILHSFEPNPQAVTQFKAKIGESAILEASLVGSEQGEFELFLASDPQCSEHGSLYSSALSEFHSYESIESIMVPMIRLDDYCERLGINGIDFIKIDTEGHELAALKGCRRLLESNQIRCIQFEFNEMNIVSRVFLKDFFDLLPGFDFFRIDSRYLRPIKYHPREEIFQFQNIVAVLRDDPIADILRKDTN